jgi:hypothetical protein
MPSALALSLLAFALAPSAQGQLDKIIDGLGTHSNQSNY